MANVILEEKTIDGFTDSGMGLAYAYSQSVDFTITAGTQYKVVWDGTEYICTAGDDEGVYLGNLFIAAGDGNDTGEPFFMASNEQDNITLYYTSDTTATSHTVAIYLAADEESTSYDIILKDRDGNNVNYEGVEAVKLMTADGEYVTFSNVSSGGGGSGSLPAGLYWEQYEPMAPSNSTSHFMFNGNHYVNYGSGSGGSTIYQETLDGYTAVITGATIYTTANPTVYNGKLHFLYGYHYTFDGESLVTLTRPYNAGLDTAAVAPFVWDGKLYCTDETNKTTFYVWDESTDTWSATDTIVRNSSMNAYAFPFIHNDELYWVYQRNIYKLVNGEVTTYKTLSSVPSLVSVGGYCDGYIYFYRPFTGYHKIYRYDMSTGEELYLGMTPYITNVPSFFVFNDQPYYARGQNCLKLIYISE